MKKTNYNELTCREVAYKESISHKMFKWTKPKNERAKLVTYVHVYQNDNEEWIEITGHNPFPFKRESKLYTSRSIFETWMKENGFEKELRLTDCFRAASVVTKYIL